MKKQTVFKSYVEKHAFIEGGAMHHIEVQHNIIKSQIRCKKSPTDEESTCSR